MLKDCICSKTPVLKPFWFGAYWRGTTTECECGLSVVSGFKTEKEAIESYNKITDTEKIEFIKCIEEQERKQND